MPGELREKKLGKVVVSDKARKDSQDESEKHKEGAHIPHNTSIRDTGELYPDSTSQEMVKPMGALDNSVRMIEFVDSDAIQYERVQKRRNSLVVSP